MTREYHDHTLQTWGRDTGDKLRQKSQTTRPRSYKAVFVLNPTEHEISSLSGVVFIMLINAKMPSNIYEQDKFRAQLS